ncbi:MAG TPA: hypothetical protein VHB79_37055 [Polyangiaceae bacterium]|nr:hypothetical protein [Polyangiaceae bacterium]
MSLRRAALLLPLAMVQAACSGQLDAGYDVPHGALPVDERSAMVVVNDGARDNWQGEYAALLAATTPLRLVGIVVNATFEYPSLETNLAGYTDLIAAARDSGLQGLPDPVGSAAPALVKPESERIEDTKPNGSAGAKVIIDAAKRWGTVAHPLAIATGGALTDVADAWLLDPTLADRAVVVASLGMSDGSGVRTSNPNGGRDEWATFIATSRLRFVQVSGYYDQLADFPDARRGELPQNAFGDWIAAKSPDILDLLQACDQVSVLAAALPWFAQDVTRLRIDDTDLTLLDADPEGPIWHVGRGDSDRAREQVWAALTNPNTFH